MIKFARVFVLCGVVVLGQVPAVMAGGSLMQSANRLAQQAGRQAPVAAVAAGRAGPNRFAAAEQGTLAESGMSKRKKWFITIAAVLGVAGGIYAIDRGVEDNTPSSKGTRKD